MQKPRIKLPAAQWRRREAFLPGKPTDPGRPGFNHRKTVAGLLGIARAGARPAALLRPRECYSPGVSTVG